MFFPKFEDLVLLLRCPLIPAHVRIDHIDPAFATLSGLSLTSRSNSLVELFSNPRPFLRLTSGVPALHALCRNFVSDFAENLSLTGGPCGLLSLYILDEQPALLALTRDASGD